MSDGGHSLLSPSSAARWLACSGSVWLARGLPDQSSKYAEEGTLAHAVAAACLELGCDANIFLGNHTTGPLAGYSVPPEMVGYVQTYVDNVRERAGEGLVEVEQKVDFGALIGQPGQKGTADVVILKDSTLTVIDLKYGKGIAVDAEQNPQAMLYAIGCLQRYELLHDIETVVIEIHMPRQEHISTWTTTPAELHEFAKVARHRAEKAMAIYETGIAGAEDFTEGDHCRFCRAKALCPKLESRVLAEVQFESLDEVEEKEAFKRLSALSLQNLGLAGAALPIVEQWCLGVRAAIEANLFEGKEVPGWKLVQGKKGNRKWADEAQAEEFFRKTCRLDEIYKMSLLSPTQIEKRLEPWVDDEGNKREPILGPRQVKRMPKVAQEDGKPSVAPASDKRPAIPLTVNNFVAIADDIY